LLTYPTLSSILALFGRRFYLSGSIRVSPILLFIAKLCHWNKALSMLDKYT